MSKSKKANETIVEGLSLIYFFTFSTAVHTIILIANYFWEQEINCAEGEKTSGFILSMLFIQLIAIIALVGFAYFFKN